MASYWSNTLNQRLSRRRAITATAGAATAVAFLAACGGSSDSGGTVAKVVDKETLVTKPVDETKQVKRGGTFIQRAGSGVPTQDPHLTIQSQAIANWCYSLLFGIKEGLLEAPNGELVGDTFESWELSPDKLTLTGKVSPNAHFAPQPPVNGRVVDARDVEFSWKRVLALSPIRSQYANEINPAAAFVSMTAMDDRTVVIKLARPDATIFPLLATQAPQTPMIAPKEAADVGVLDLRTTTRGAGPWYLESYSNDIGYVMKRNPGYKQDKRDVPYMDAMDYKAIPEYGAALAQIRAGNIWNLGTGDASITVPDAVQLKKDAPQIDLRTYVGNTIFRAYFGTNAQSPFKDERVRQALNMVIDRNLFLDVFAGYSDLKSQGVELNTWFENAIPAQSTPKDWLLDPRDKRFGPNAKYMLFDVPEAKKLLAAAGFANGVDADFHLPQAGSTFTGGTIWHSKIMEPYIGMAEDSKLFRFTRKQYVQGTEWNPQFQFTSGNWSGMGATVDGAVFNSPDPTNVYLGFLHSASSRVVGDPTMDALINKALAEFDVQKRKELGWDIQRLAAQRLYAPRIASADNLNPYWPVIRNAYTYQIGAARSRQYLTMWIDPTKAPLNKPA